MYEWESMKTENLARDISSVLFCNHEWTACIHHQTIVTFKTGTKLEEEKKFATKQNGGLWVLPKVSIKLKTEWQEIFDKAWKLQKEHSNSGNTNDAIDWDTLYDKFNALLPTARTRNDVNKIIMQFHGAIGLSHNYITNRGDIYKPQRINTVGTLSAQWKYQNNAWYIEKVLDDTSLARCGIKSNTLIKSIDGIQLDQHTSPNQALLGKAASKVHLETANDIFMVCTSKANGRPFYQDFIQQNAKIVGPDIGYIHIPDMTARGMKYFWNQYKLVYNKKALLLDVRNNGGGNASSTIFSYLLRKRIGLDLARYTHDYEYLSFSPTGPMVLITNEWTCSDGELFAVAFKDMKLGPVVGMRTWGGVIGIESSDTHRFNDHGVTTQAAFPLVLNNGVIIENKGVEPDIVIENKPGCLEDTQLLKAKEIVTGLIK
jgi:tricorn protease